MMNGIALAASTNIGTNSNGSDAEITENSLYEVIDSCRAIQPHILLRGFFFYNLNRYSI
jgi:hypothetical protein